MNIGKKPPPKKKKNKQQQKNQPTKKTPLFFGVCTCIYIKKKTKKTKQTPNKQMFDS